MSKEVGLPLSKEDRKYFEEMMAEAAPYSEGDPELCRIDGTGYDWDRQMASLAASLLRRDDQARQDANLKDGEFPEVSGGKVYKIYE